VAKKHYVVEPVKLPEEVAKTGKQMFSVVEKRIVARCDTQEDADTVALALEAKERAGG
jgi:hypothetical protein